MSPVNAPTTKSNYVPLPILGQEFAEAPKTDFTALRTELSKKEGKAFWRSLDELTKTEEFIDYAKHEFPGGVDIWNESISRRNFLKIMGASFGMAFLTSCRKPVEKIIPYTETPENIIPGRPIYFASVLPFQGYGQGVLVESHEGRPTKVEGNPEHPDSFGAASIFMQAALLGLYDPDRSKTILQDESLRTWDEAIAFLKQLRKELQANGGAKLRFLTGATTSPSLSAQMEQLKRIFPNAKWHRYDSVNKDNSRQAARLAFGRDVDVIYQIQKADVIVSFDSDFLGSGLGQLQYSKHFAKRRQAENDNTMNRLYVVEPTPTPTGTMADHRLALRATHIEHALAFVANRLGLSANVGAELNSYTQDWLKALASDLEKNRGSSLVIAGENQTPRAQALAHAINTRLGNMGRTVLTISPVETQPVLHAESLKDLVTDMQQGSVDTLFVFGTNPAYSAPGDLPFKEAISKVKNRIHLGLYQDETSELCNWHIAQAHPLESWGDLRAFDGTASLMQPLIAPLYDGKTASEVLSAFLDESPLSSHDLVKNYWKKRSPTVDFEFAWDKTLHDGVIPGTAFSPLGLSARTSDSTVSTPFSKSDEIEVAIRPDPTIWDGSYANNGWLQECPKPVTKLTWDNAAIVSPATAEKLGLHKEQTLSISTQGKSVTVPVWIQPGQAEQTITVYLGYGRQKVGRVGNKAGVDVQPLRTVAAMSAIVNPSLQKHSRRYALASTQNHYALEGREPIQIGTLDEYNTNPTFAKKEFNPKKSDSLYPNPPTPQSEDYQWGMTIDLNLCTGCNGCLVACQSENNIPIVGKKEVAKGREMHWIRIDSYFAGDLDNPELQTQPVGCMQCENAPCEVVCPVSATTHDSEGLNTMTYNRCVGTRYCSNNCPYKVRRFNFLSYTKDVKGPLELMQNPDVTVRMRGVMEKCTYCVQRISVARIDAKNENRTIRDGEVTPACGQSCPTQAITFGNLLDAKSKVSELKKNPREYGLLSELGTRPRTTYLARIRNPNPEIEALKI